jgi:four helix bundle protein
LQQIIVQYAAHVLQLISFLKMGVVLEEADESLFWLELLTESGIATREKLGPLLKEADELVSIFVASLRTAKGIGTKAGVNDAGSNTIQAI